MMRTGRDEAPPGVFFCANLELRNRIFFLHDSKITIR